MSDVSLGPPGVLSTDEDESADEGVFGSSGTVVRNNERGTKGKISTARSSLAGGGTFSRPDPRTGREGLTWTSELEKIFRQHCEASLKRCVELTKSTGSGAMKR
jgi:hypothetical protein